MMANRYRTSTLLQSDKKKNIDERQCFRVGGSKTKYAITSFLSPVLVNRDFSLSTFDRGFESWASGGITTIGHLDEKETLLSFYQQHEK